MSAFTCRSCGQPVPDQVLSLGDTPLANSLLTTEQVGRPERNFPLTLVFCQSCFLLQIRETVAPEALFREYLYFSSYSDTMVDHARQLAERLVETRALGPESLILEVASNDGYLLSHYIRAGVRVLGIEPARNVARVAIERGVETLCEFFGADMGDRLAAEGRAADVIHANNVLAHVPDLDGFVGGLAAVLKPDGVVVVEVPYVRDMLERIEFDTIYHEHLSYFSVTAVQSLVARHGLMIQDVERIPIHGGSLRLFLTKMSAGVPADLRVKQLLEQEEAWGVRRAATYLSFADGVRSVTRALVDLLQKLKRDGKVVAAYGAAAKGSTLLNVAGIGPDLVAFVVDRSPHKQGLFMPGVKIPIHPPSRLLEVRPDYVLLLAWNVAAEILDQQVEYRRQGGRFIIPLPDVAIV